MIEILTAVGWFVLLAGVANVLQYFYGTTYKKNALIFVSLFLLGVCGIWYTTSLSSITQFSDTLGILLGVLGVASYVTFCGWWNRTFTLEQMYGVATLPKSYQQLLAPNANSALSKAGEILVQDVVLLVIVTELLRMNYSYLAAGGLFSVIVFIIHIPSPYIIGRIYGVWLTVLATLFALCIPWLIGEYSYGFYTVFLFHMFVYVLLLLVSRLAQRNFG